MKKFLIFVMMSAMALIGCGKEEVKEEGKLTKVQIVLDWTPNTNHTGIFVAKEKGYFEENGLDVEILPAPEGSTTQLIGSGKSLGDGNKNLGITFKSDIISQNNISIIIALYFFKNLNIKKLPLCKEVLKL